MLNDPTVGTLAQRWAERLRRLAEPANAKERLRAMFLQAFGRQPTDDELARSRQFLDENEAVFTQQRQRRRELVDRRDELQQQIDTALQQARARLTSDAADVPRQASLPAAVASWDFAENARDQIGRAHLQLHEGARCGRQGLIVRNGGYAVTDPIDLALQEKTLEAWVRLDDLEQRGGGVMSLQTPDGRVFDAIVFGEKTPRRWLAGSEYFNRTESFGGTDEAVAEEGADKSFVQIVLTYHADGTIRAFRNGVAYGTEYASDGPQAFAADAAVISFGVRHLPAGGNRLLSGVIRRARLYDRALTPDQVASAARAGGWISDRDLLAALDPKTRGRVVELRRRHRELKTTLDAMPDLAEDPRQQAWVELARSLFLFKEFMYVR
jgi:hypothetical protein